MSMRRASGRINGTNKDIRNPGCLSLTPALCYTERDNILAVGFLVELRGG